MSFERRGNLVGWASRYIDRLRAGETVVFRPRGHSMKGRIESGHLCTVAPFDTSRLEVGDIVLCRVAGNEYLHIVKAINGNRFQIGNNRGRINGWIGPNGIFGKSIRVENWRPLPILTANPPRYSGTMLWEIHRTACVNHIALR